MKREKRLTKRERKALEPARPSGAPVSQAQHIHCIACGRHLDPQEFRAPASAQQIRCQHGSSFSTCTGCVERSRELLAEHDRTGQNVQIAAAWH